MSGKDSVKKARHILYSARGELSVLNGKNKLANRYIKKLTFMLFWLAIFTKCTKKFVDNWKMPDYEDIKKIEKGEKK